MAQDFISLLSCATPSILILSMEERVVAMCKLVSFYRAHPVRLVVALVGIGVIVRSFVKGRDRAADLESWYTRMSSLNEAIASVDLGSPELYPSGERWGGWFAEGRTPDDMCVCGRWKDSCICK